MSHREWASLVEATLPVAFGISLFVIACIVAVWWRRASGGKVQ